jgi:hypothetical protein
MEAQNMDNNEHFNILNAIWILSCNDENPILTYEGIQRRLSLRDNYDIKALIKNRTEMFRLKVPQHRLIDWKNDMRGGRRIPSWIQEIDDPKAREKKIESITVDDVFRNQFRAGGRDDRLPIEIVDWGLNHIERLRNAAQESREEKVKQISGIWIPLLTTILAIVAIISSTYTQYSSMKNQSDLKKYEVSFNSKRDGYAMFIRQLTESYDSAYKGIHPLLVSNLDRAETALLIMEPFLSEEVRTAIWDQYRQFSAMCYMLSKESYNSDKRKSYRDKFIFYKHYFHDRLYKSLFP